MAEEVERLSGPRYKPGPESPYQRAGSEKGVAYLDGGKDEIRRPRVRHETEGEVQLATYAAASSPQGSSNRCGPRAAGARRGTGF